MINQKFIDYCNERALDVSKALAFCLWWSRGDTTTINSALACGFISASDMDYMRIELCDIEGGLKIALFEDVVNVDFVEFRAFLRKNNVESNGHINCPRDSSIFGILKEDELAYTNLCKRIKDATPERLAMVVSDYYENTKFSYGLQKLFATATVDELYKKMTEYGRFSD